MSSSAIPAADPLLEAFWQRGLILLGESVRREYALDTPIFIDLRHKLYDDLDTLSALGRALHSRIAALAPDARPQQIIGIPDTATPIALAAALASQGATPALFYGQLRKEPAHYPGGRYGASAYMGVADPAREITLVDDVMASGRTKLKAMEDLGKEGLKVARILVVVDREEGGESALAESAVPLYSLYKVSELIDYFESRGKLDPATARKAREHIRKKRFR